MPGLSLRLSRLEKSAVAPVWGVSRLATVVGLSQETSRVSPLCCTDQQPGAVSPAQRHLWEANVLRPAKLEHAVQRGGSNGHLGRLPASGP
jgi:hypothetical protein